MRSYMRKRETTASSNAALIDTAASLPTKCRTYQPERQSARAVTAAPTSGRRVRTVTQRDGVRRGAPSAADDKRPTPRVAAGGRRDRLRYRTDLDKPVVHYMFDRHPTTAEEVIVSDEDNGGGERAADDSEKEDTGKGEWHLFWMSVGRIRSLFATSDYRLKDYQIVNHFPNHYELTRKDSMYKNVKRYIRSSQANGGSQLLLATASSWEVAAAYARTGVPTKEHEGLVDIFSFADSVPITYNIPNDLGMFLEEFKRHPGATWIVKPTSRSQGKGIFLLNRTQQLTRWMKEKKAAEELNAEGSPLGPKGAGAAGGFSDAAGIPSAGAGNSTSRDPQNLLGSFIISKYISNPLLIAGKKFDLRLYVLVTSYRPLVAYLHREGFARFCATRYAGNKLSEEDLGSHLTNVALQKGDENYNSSHGGKWTFANVLLYLQTRYGAYMSERLVKSIEFLIFHSLKAMEAIIFNDKHSFELYGYDILIDDAIRPHLIEVNASPSLSATTQSDRLLKEEVLVDTLRIVLPPKYPSPEAMPYWMYRVRTDLTTKQKTGFKLLDY